MNAGVQLSSVLLCVSGKIRPSDSPYEKGVACEDEPWGRPPPQVGDDQADAFRRMPGRVQHGHLGISQVDLLAIPKGSERQLDVRRLVQAIVGADLSGELQSTGTMIGVDVRVDDTGDAHVLGRRECCIRLHVVGARVHYRAFSKCAAAEEVRGADKIEIEERTKNHRGTVHGPFVTRELPRQPCNERDDAESPCESGLSGPRARVQPPHASHAYRQVVTAPDWKSSRAPFRKSFDKTPRPSAVL